MVMLASRSGVKEMGIIVDFRLVAEVGNETLKIPWRCLCFF